jgi:hypothetical protein
MTPKEVKDLYGTNYNFYLKTGMAPNTLANWVRWGYVPANAQCKIELITDGLLKADLSHDPK